MIQTTEVSITYKGDGVQTSFPYPYPYRNSDDIVGYIINDVGYEKRITNNFKYDKVSNIYQYPLAGAPLAAPYSIKLIRETPQQQNADLPGKLPFSLIEKSLDWIIMILQEIGSRCNSLWHIRNDCKLSETNARNSASAAAESEENIANSENLTKKWAMSSVSPDGVIDTNSPTGYTQSSRSWALYSKGKAQEAATSEAHAKTSETNAKVSETKALASEQNAKVSETNAKASETNAKTSETNAKTSETKSLASETNAKDSETNALSSENSARSHAQSAYSYATTAQSWAESEGSPDGKDDSLSTTGKTKSAKGWAMQAKEYAGSLDLSFIINTVFPVGTIIEFINDTDPNELYQGTTWVKMDAGRVLVSAGTYTENGTTYTYNLGDKGGEAKHQNTIEEMTNHTHTTYEAGNHRHFIANTDNNNTTGGLNGGTHLIYKYTQNSYENFELMGSNMDSNIGLTSTNGNHTHSISETGGNQPHENRMPYEVVHRWKRIA
uniref:phage baseplate protein n=1 Tax=Megasphaera elsdenii TaxID=907 RepID=UPI003FEE54C8